MKDISRGGQTTKMTSASLGKPASIIPSLSVGWLLNMMEYDTQEKHNH